MTKYVVMISHGEFAPGLRTAVFMMTGPHDEVLCTNLKDGMSADTFQENFRNLIAPITADDEIILLADILGGSPMTKALEVLAEKDMLAKTLVFTGMNMPMAMTAVIMKDNMDLASLKDVVLSEAKNAVSDYNPLPAADDAEDDI